MAFSTRIFDYLGEGTAASRPATINIYSGAVGLYYATDTKALSLWNGASWDSTNVGGSNIWNPVASLGGAKPQAGQELFKIVLSYPTSLPAGLTGSYGGCEVAAAASAVFTLYKNGSSIGTATISGGSTSATFSFSSMVSFVAGDLFSFNAPSVQDALLSGPYFSFLGSR